LPPALETFRHSKGGGTAGISQARTQPRLRRKGE